MHLDVRQNFEEKAAYLARFLPGMTIIDQGALLSIDCGQPCDTFNVVVLRDPMEAAEALALSIGRFTSKGFPMALWYWEKEEHEDMAELLQHGLVFAETNTAMAVDLSASKGTAPQVEGLEIKRVTTASELLQMADIMLTLFEGSEEGHSVFAYYQRLSAYALSAFPDMHYYLGKLHNKVVATGTLFVGSQTAGIYDMATLAEHRKRGIGSAMFQHLLDDARSSQRSSCVLQASEDGLGIYMQAGFKPVGNIQVFENRELL